MPHPLLIPDANPAYRRLRDAYGEVRKRIEELNPDLLLLYSTQWPSVIGHQVQADPWPEWTYVDQEWHELGSIPYKFRVDAAFGEAYVAAGRARGLEMRTVAYHGFPVDVGSIVALKLLNPDNRFPASIVSCNMYADRAETIVLGKAARDAIAKAGKRVVAVAVTALSNRLFPAAIPWAEDRIHSRKDDEWNRKYLEFLERGRLEDASQLAREFAAQANGDSRMKAIWWLAAVSGAHNRYGGTLFAYEPVYGTGCALVGLVPTAKAALDKEFDEDDPEVHMGDRNVLGGANPFESAEGVEATVRLQLQTAGLLGAKGPPAPANAPSSGTPAGAPPGSVAWNDEELGDDGKPVPRVASLLAAAPAGKAVVQKDQHEKALAPATALAPPAPPALPSRSPSPRATKAAAPAAAAATPNVIHAKGAPKPVGAYAHARRVGDLLFLAGIGPRVPGTDEIPGGPVHDNKGNPLDYDIRAQTRQCIENVRTVLRESGAGLEDVFDVSVFLVDMRRDFAGFNEVYAEFFQDIQAARTTVQVEALPRPIAVELKVVAKAPGGQA